MTLPDKIPIRYQPEYRSWCIGHYDDGQFLGCVVVGNAKDYLARAGPGHSLDFLDPHVDDLLLQRVLHDRDFVNHQRHYSVLHLFDHDGRYQSTDLWYAGTGEGEPVKRAFARLQEQVDALPGRRYGDIAIGLFEADLEVDDLWFELVDESSEERGDWAELYPNRWGFHPPWDGGYDT
jgi:hypothetical protein